jgi:membrane associated rhomboid family serine protease
LTNLPAQEGLSPTGSVRDRLLVALADPEIAGKAGRNPATLVAFHEPMAVFEWLGLGTGLVLLNYENNSEGSEEELRAHVERIVHAHEKGLLFIAVAGGGASVAGVLRAADAETRNRDHIGMYQVDGAGKVKWVAGRRLRELEKAGRVLPQTRPLSPENVASIIERGRKERLEAMEFVRGTARRFPHLTVGIIAVCVLLFALTSGNDERAQKLFLLLCNRPDAVRAGELWRLVTYALLHDPRNPTHLIVNMLSLYSLGAFLEPLLGRLRLGLLFIVTAAVGGIASTLFTGDVSIGASGAVWGLVGATLGLLSGRQRLFPALIARSLRKRLVVILVINVVISFMPHIDRYCHFGGGIAGYLIALYFARKPLNVVAA